jgi:ribA/ribD-fused uncharacterized protein
MHFGDSETARRILHESEPAEYKALGRAVRGFRRTQWDRVAQDHMRDGAVFKFRQNPALRDALLRTGERRLISATPNDTIWGIGMDEDAARTVPPDAWPGQNTLGIVLEQVREVLRIEQQVMKSRAARSQPQPQS